MNQLFSRFKPMTPLPVAALLSILLTINTCSELGATPVRTSQDAILEESPQRNTLFIAWPRDGTKVSAASTFIVGCTAPSKQIFINGAPARHNAQGFFAQVVNLNYGNNPFALSFSENGPAEKTINVVRPGPAELPAPPQFGIAQESIEPRQDTGVSVGDLVILKAIATPGGEVSVKLPNNKIVILSPAPAVRLARKKQVTKSTRQARSSKTTRRKGTPAGSKHIHAGKPSRDASALKELKEVESVANSPPEAHVNNGLAFAYGKVFQSLPPNRDDLYVGFYKIQPDDDFNDRPLKFSLKKNGKSTSVDSPGKLTVLSQPHIVQTIHDDTIIRVAPDKARLTPLPAGVRLLVDGWQGDNLRCIYAAGHHAFIKAEDAAYEKGSPHASGPVPKSPIGTVNIIRTAYGEAVVVPLNQRLPFVIEQAVNPNRLVVKIFGGVSNTDFASQEYKSAFEEGQSEQSGSRKNTNQAGLVDGINWKQQNDDTYELTIKLRGNRQWGFQGSYAGTHLLINIKDPPRIGDSSSQAMHSLQGLSICLDPGHGGAQTGAMGCSGVSEARVNLAIALRAKQLLESEGARVIMTRTTDSDIDLGPRCEIARSQGADILLSIHNNSLPDGRDPWKEHGTSAYWYHPQAIELARALKDSLADELGYPDMGARYQNLALTRPSTQLSVLVEVGFMINPDEYASLIKLDTQQRAAQALVKGLKKYLTGNDGSQ